jgi:hypothetical protein
VKDSRILHFLKNFPPWIILTALTVFMVMLFFRTGDASYKEWTSLILASLFTALGVRAAQPASSATTTSGDVNITPEANEPPNLTEAEITGAVEQLREEGK